MEDYHTTPGWNYPLTPSPIYGIIRSRPRRFIVKHEFRSFPARIPAAGRACQAAATVQLMIILCTV